jgi:hypothetical protein
VLAYGLVQRIAGRRFGCNSLVMRELRVENLLSRFEECHGNSVQ